MKGILQCCLSLSSVMHIRVEIRQFSRDTEGLQDLCEEKYEGRPHWGKVNWVNEDTPQQLASVYPQFDTFLKLAQRLDPEGRFNSVYLKERFGQ